MEEEKKFVQWLSELTITDAANVFLMITFTIMILFFVLRTFRNKPSA